MCALSAAHKISIFSKMRAIHCINAQNGHLAQLNSQGEAGAQNKMCKNVLSSLSDANPGEWFYFNCCNPVKREHPQILSKWENPKCCPYFGSFWFFLQNANPGEWFISAAVRTSAGFVNPDFKSAGKAGFPVRLSSPNMLNFISKLWPFIHNRN